MKFTSLIQIRVRPRKTARIRSQDNIHAFLHAESERFLLEFNHRSPISTAARRHVRPYHHSRTPVRALLYGLIEQRLRESVSMLDRVNARPKRSGDAIRPNRM